jgi:hypothetical protein
MKTPAEEDAYGAGNVTADNRVQFQACLSNAGIAATTWRMTHTNRFLNQL